MGAQLCPDSIAASTPQTFLAASLGGQAMPPAESPAASLPDGARCCPAQIYQVRAGSRITGVQPLVHLRYASLPRLPNPGHLAVLARPGVVGAAPTRPCDSRVWLPPASTEQLRQPGGEALHPTRFNSASWRTAWSSNARVNRAL
jgi:hypothetical protein